MAQINQNLIAKRLNISRATVSRSLANHPAISSETRAKVHSMAEEMGYRISLGRMSRRHAKGAKRLTVGVLIGIPAENVVMATFPHILKGIRDRAEVERIKVDIYYQPPGDFHPESNRNPLFRHLRDADWRGALLIYPFAEAAVEAISRRISTVAVLESYSYPGIDIIDTDDASGVLGLVECLRAAGHSKIGFLSWLYPIGGHWVARRFSGYVEALYLHGLEFNPDWVINVHKKGPQLKTNEVSDLVAHHVKNSGVTAWVCAADHQAYPVISDLRARGIRVPEDCSITGFDGLEPPPGLPRATSMRVPHEHIGASALNRLINRLEHPSSPRRKIFVEADLVQGETIAPARTL
ncbi:MAG: LacI family DNA-binding transcriptional regulator [Opitutae bacterium]|nr:LacI family DNA-binding transcriptional regulator [Opitutae bacterium]